MTTPKLITTCAVLHAPGPDADENGRMCVGHCPACHQAVYDDGGKAGQSPATDPMDGPVWTCPTGLSDGNPHQAERDDRITDALQEREGCYSNCTDDFGNLGPCPYDHMPLHSECYGNPDITY